MAARTYMRWTIQSWQVCQTLEFEAEMWWLEIEIPPPGAGIVTELNAYNSGVN